MVDLLRKLDAGLIGILNLIVIVTSLAITGLILFLVLARFVLGWSVVGVLELATLSAMWLYMCGAVVAARNHEHLVVDFLALSLKNPKSKALHTFAVSMIMVVLSLFFLGLANDMVAWSIKRPQTTAALSIPLIVPQSAVVFAAVLCTVYAVRDAIVAAAAVFGKTNQNAGEV
ncbi:TRAP transporter small permease [Hoeflea alexandrii]|uniref:TRAP transporter small permease n=1 Tax=Hoeflea alexandrii TaxID=288436 RepID=UPI0022AF45F2|nr:TRAP transporter small permease subunit [Hoeflea alexandrii]MCZ4292269.1 TRAP transporter small permease subunit [Hoeflea alexandrii]